MSCQPEDREFARALSYVFEFLCGALDMDSTAYCQTLSDNPPAIADRLREYAMRKYPNEDWSETWHVQRVTTR